MILKKVNTQFATLTIACLTILAGCGGGGSDSGGGSQDVNLASECIATPAAGSGFIRAQNTCDFAVNFSIHFSRLGRLGPVVPLQPNQSSNPFGDSTLDLDTVTAVACRAPTNPQLDSNRVVCR